MLCENCKKNNATTYFKQNINGNIQEVYLCSECAAKLDMGGMSSSLFDFFMPNQFRIRAEREQKKCGCGTTFYNISKTGKVGCPDCYETFRNELSAVLKKINGAKQHTGRCPRRFENGKTEDKKVAQPEVKEENLEAKLRKELENAIKCENFEEAAKLRDQIKALKEENGNEQQ